MGSVKNALQMMNAQVETALQGCARTVPLKAFDGVRRIHHRLQKYLTVRSPALHASLQMNVVVGNVRMGYVVDPTGSLNVRSAIAPVAQEKGNARVRNVGIIRAQMEATPIWSPAATRLSAARARQTTTVPPHIAVRGNVSFIRMRVW